jgi:hypothetical protein
LRKRSFTKERRREEREREREREREVGKNTGLESYNRCASNKEFVLHNTSRLKQRWHQSVVSTVIYLLIFVIPLFYIIIKY